MEVMDSRELQQTEVLIGQRGKSTAMGVSDDAMLMSMLSTGLYQNPLRTMLQEIMFNAWDAHRMGDCQDKPFDIYLNDTTGLIVRDYGPGIDPDDMVPIYCIYGNSTKRDNKDLTGGFGLGSKSPFAYCDSFTVTSMFNKTKNMYIIMKNSEEHDGKPGITPLIEGVDTEEHGLMVTVPIKSEQDRIQAYEYIKDISYLSGMKFNLHFTTGDDTQVELFDCESLAPGSFTTKICREHGVYAVYGGVRYEIQQDIEYQDEYNFLYNLSRSVGAFYIGFKPNSLTPLPSREGLNLSDKTKENIKAQIEMIYEQMSSLIGPAINKVVKFAIDMLITSCMEEVFITKRWKRLTTNPLVGALSGWTDRFGSIDRKAFMESEEWFKIKSEHPDSVTEDMWGSLLWLALSDTGRAETMWGGDITTTMARMHYLRFKNTQARSFILDRDTKSSLSFKNKNLERSIKCVNKTQKSLQDLTGQKCQMRLNIGSKDKWIITSKLRGAGKTQAGVTDKQLRIIKTLSINKKLKKPTIEHTDRLWLSNNGNEINRVLYSNSIILAKSVALLNSTNFSFKDIAVSNVPDSQKDCIKRDLYRWIDTGNINPVPAFVISDKKGMWEKAKELLEEKGYHVILADEPEEEEKGLFDYDTPLTAPAKVKPTDNFYIVNTNRHYWSDEDNETIEGIKDPKVYLWMTKGEMDEYSYYNNPKPGRIIVKEILRIHPKTVMLYNKQREGTLIKRGAICFAQAIENRVKKIVNNKERYRTMYLHLETHKHSKFPEELLLLPEMQKCMGLPYIRTKQKEDFARDRKFIRAIQEDRTKYVYGSTRDLIYKAEKEYANDPQARMVHKICSNSIIFRKEELQKLVLKNKLGENKILSQQIIRLMKTLRTKD